MTQANRSLERIECVADGKRRARKYDRMGSRIEHLVQGVAHIEQQCRGAVDIAVLLTVNRSLERVFIRSLLKYDLCRIAKVFQIEDERRKLPLRKNRLIDALEISDDVL